MKKKYLVKTIEKNIIEVEGVMMKTPLKNKPPKWFIDYMEVFQQTLNQRFNKIEKDLNEVKNELNEVKRDFNERILILEKDS